MSPEVLTKPAPVIGSGRRGWFQYGLRSVILLTVACALGVTWWRQLRQNAELDALRAKNHLLQRELEIHRAIADVSTTLDLKNPEHRRIAQLIANMGLFFGDSVIRQRIKFQERHCEVMVFHHDSSNSHDMVQSIAVLTAGGKLVDYVIHNESAWHEVKVEDAGNGTVDLVYHCRNEFVRRPNSFTERFAISPEGFHRIDIGQSRAASDSASRSSVSEVP